MGDSEEKPRTINDYKQWLKNRHSAEVTLKTRNHYDSVAERVRSEFSDRQFWRDFPSYLRQCDGEYRVSTGYPLLASDAPAGLLLKPFDSFLMRSFRHNVLNNVSWPGEPEGGWILPRNWFSRIRDIVRTAVAVKYLDGVEFLIGKIEKQCTDVGVDFKASLEAREEGYYAAHLSLTQDFEVPKITWDTETIPVSVEVQITTQLQEVIRVLLHRFYDQRRQQLVSEADPKWQWSYRSEEFAANYLGHILHYVEGMIMEVRDRGKGSR